MIKRATSIAPARLAPTQNSRKIPAADVPPKTGVKSARGAAGAQAPEDESMGVRIRLMSAAEEVFAEQGIMGASLREIARRAGQANPSVLHYHFASREKLLDELMLRRGMETDSRRVQFFMNMEAAGRPLTVQDVVRGMALPVAEYMNHASSRYAIRFLAASYLRPEFDLSSFVDGKHDTGFLIAKQHLRRLIPHLPERTLMKRIAWVRTSILFSLAELDAHRLRRQAKGKSFDLERSMALLVKAYTAALCGPAE